QVGDALDLRLDRPDEEPLRVLRRNATLGELDIDDRDLDVGRGFLWDADLGRQARDHQEGEDGDRQPGMADREIDDAPHAGGSACGAGAASAAETASTGSPSLTKSWPTVMTRVAPARPVTHTISRPSSTISIGMKRAWLFSSATRTPSRPSSEKTSAERGTAAASTGSSETVISQVTPSATAASWFGMPASTRQVRVALSAERTPKAMRPLLHW